LPVICAVFGFLRYDCAHFCRVIGCLSPQSRPA
jgi:hypothetical protein